MKKKVFSFSIIFALVLSVMGNCYLLAKVNNNTPEENVHYDYTSYSDKATLNENVCYDFPQYRENNYTTNTNCYLTYDFDSQYSSYSDRDPLDENSILYINEYKTYDVRDLVGQEIIRKAPTEASNGRDWSFTMESVRLMAFSDDGNMIVATSNGLQTLDPIYMDNNWIPYEEALKTDNSISLSQHIYVRRFRRIHPTVNGDKSYSDEDGVKIVSINKYHMTVIGALGDRSILNSRYANPEDWEIVY